MAQPSAAMASSADLAWQHSDTSEDQVPSNKLTRPRAPIWWENATFFIGMHILAIVGIVNLSPWSQLQSRTLWMCIASWQLATFGITLGYHRLWSHRAFTASLPLRIVLAGMGCLGFQGSIKWWVLRHRLHHRFTDTESDPYNAKEGLYHSHMGWIFRKPTYPRMALVDRKDLDIDPVVRFQHKYYIPLTLALGLVAPTLIGWSYGDAMGGYIWGGVVARILIWHFTFFINSLAHYLGDQAYSEDLTARGNLLLAIFTGGEANHNYHHAFPKDYRNGPLVLDWDPSKWIIYALHNFTPLVPRIHQTPDYEILKARAHVLASRSARAAATNDDVAESSLATSSLSSFARWGQFAETELGGDSTSGSGTSEPEEGFSTGIGSSADSSCGSSAEAEADIDAVDALFDNARLNSRLTRRGRRGTTTAGKATSASASGTKLPTWSHQQLISAVEASNTRPLVIVLHGYAVDCTTYARHHPGGVALLRRFAVEPKTGVVPEGATDAFEGGLNDHGWAARERMRAMRVARIVDVPGEAVKT